MVKYSLEVRAVPYLSQIFFRAGNLSMKPRQGRKKGALKKRTPPGASPGTLVADPSAVKTKIDLIAYGSSDFVETDISRPEEIIPFKNKGLLLWVNISGLGDVGILREIGEIFGLHPLTLEDSINVYQRPKIEQYGSYFYIVARMVDKDHHPSTEQLSLFLGHQFVVTIQERPGDCFDPIRERIRTAKGRIRTLKADFLAYSILDSTIDFFFPFIEKISSEVDAIEEGITTKPDRKLVQELYRLRQEFLAIRRAIGPLRDAIAILQKEPHNLIQEETRPYLRDCYDHTAQLLDSVESHRELISSLMEVYLSTASYKLNDVIRTLTVISILFMPLNLIAGIYGMNFHTNASPFNMPELDWFYGYPFALSLMILVSAGMLYFFHRKGWMRG